ncbi:MAG TPA: CvpA family protein [Dehalococcoidales bacterium]|nr:CvpA family protein [Dehalococcoidales bacterium]
MNWLDIVIIALIAIPTLIGLKIGIIKAALSLAGVILGTILAGHYYAALAEQLTFISQANLAKIAAFAIILIGVMLIAGVLAAVLKWVVSAVMLGWVNRLGGAIFGFLLGAIFCGALLAIWANFLGTGAITSSGLATLLLDRFPMVLALLPEEFDAVRSFFQ